MMPSIGIGKILKPLMLIANSDVDDLVNIKEMRVPELLGKADNY